MPHLNTVLLVDDDATTNYLNKMLLTRLSVAGQLLVAENGREALATLQRECKGAAANCPALILLDLNMPVMNGLEFLEAYQQLAWPPAQTSVIVVLTTSANANELARVRQLPVATILTKPLTAEKIRLILQDYFSQRAA